ncbi:MAG: YdcF family protein [Clostridia bacterium]|nr:YdcF family protein [Clostridia bacterium]
MSPACPCGKKGKTLSLLHKIVLFIAVVILVTVLSIFVVNLIVKGSVRENISDSPDALTFDGHVDCVVILGAGLRSNGEPSDMLEDRIKTGVEVFNQIDADFILMSGDCSGEHYDEVSAMKKYALSLGVDEDKILLDGQGFSTFESISRVKEEYGFDRVVIITQKYHLYRALYIAEQYEIEAVGVSADLRGYRGQIYRDLREVFARVKDFIITK